MPEMHALDLLNRRRLAWPFWLAVAVGTCAVILIGGVACRVAEWSEWHEVVSGWIWFVLGVAGLVAPFAARSRRDATGFMETVLLTRVSSGAWLRYRIGQALYRLLTWAVPLWLAAVVLQWSCGDEMGHVLVWLPGVALLTVAATWFAQIRRARLPACKSAPAARAFSRDPIVIREAYRSMRRGSTGPLGMLVRRYGLLAATISLLLWWRVDGVLLSGELALWALVAAVCTYWTTVAAHPNEIDLLAMSPAEFCRGWIVWSMRSRKLETLALTALVTFLWFSSGGCFPYPDCPFPSIFESAICVGLLASATAARAGLLAVGLGWRGWRAHAMCALWLVPSLTLAYLTMGYFYPESLGFVLSPIAICLVALWLAEALMRRVFAADRRSLRP